MDDLSPKFEVPNFTRYGDMTSVAKRRQVSAVADGPRDADLCTYTEILSTASRDSTATDGMCDVRVTINGSYCIGLVNYTPCVYRINGQQSRSGVAGVINKGRRRRLY